MSKNLLIVDDETIIREGLRHCLPWDELGINQVGMAQDGAQALRMIKEGGWDIVLTDIIMPELTGLQLIEKCREESIACEFIVLTSYSDFDYVHTALRQHVFDYVLKPCNPGKLRAILEELNRDTAEYSREEEKEPEERNKLIAKALEYMDAHLGDSELSLGSIASEVLFLHPDYLGKLFKREHGIKFSACLLQKRMEKARRLLMSTSDTIAEITEKCGYGDNQAYFSQLFRRQYGSTPTVFRNSLLMHCSLEKTVPKQDDRVRDGK